MQTNLSILFFIKRTKANPNGLVPIYMRVTITGQRIEMSTGKTTDPEKWIAKACKVKPGSEDARIVNHHLDQLRKKVFDYQSELMHLGQPINFDNLRNKLLGKETKKHSLVCIFEEHNKQMRALLGKEFAPGTLQRYETTLKHLKDFMKLKYNVSDIDIRNINLGYITSFEFYLRTERNCGNNVTVKYIKNLGKIIHSCIANGWIDKNPLANFKSKTREVERVFLNEEEMQAIIDRTFSAFRLAQVRDIFVFSCFTGLAYADVKKLDRSMLVKGIDGDDWIYTTRQKTESQSNIPLLPTAKLILKKYKDDPQSINKGVLLPVLSNQKLNAYLKEIADLCEIQKDLTFHTARHTFATTVTLSNGVPIETVSKMLGHKDLKITQHYAKIVDRKVSDDMKLLKQKFAVKSVETETKVGVCLQTNLNFFS
jgi:site-specific recombinase XerD